MHIHHIYTDENGESHFADIEIGFESVHFGDVDHRSRPFPATGIIFRATSANQDLDFHNAPRRQYCINLDAGVQVTVSDGETRFIDRGEIILLEDVTGKGHMSKNVEGKIRHSVFITID